MCIRDRLKAAVWPHEPRAGRVSGTPPGRRPRRALADSVPDPPGANETSSRRGRSRCSVAVIPLRAGENQIFKGRHAGGSPSCSVAVIPLHAARNQNPATEYFVSGGLSRGWGAAPPTGWIARGVARGGPATQRAIAASWVCLDSWQLLWGTSGGLRAPGGTAPRCSAPGAERRTPGSAPGIGDPHVASPPPFRSHPHFLRPYPF